MIVSLETPIFPYLVDIFDLRTEFISLNEQQLEAAAQYKIHNVATSPVSIVLSAVGRVASVCIPRSVHPQHLHIAMYVPVVFYFVMFMILDAYMDVAAIEIYGLPPLGQLPAWLFLVTGVSYLAQMVFNAMVDCHSAKVSTNDAANELFARAANQIRLHINLICFFSMFGTRFHYSIPGRETHNIVVAVEFSYFLALIFEQMTGEFSAPWSHDILTWFMGLFILRTYEEGTTYYWQWYHPQYTLTYATLVTNIIMIVVLISCAMQFLSICRRCMRKSISEMLKRLSANPLQLFLMVVVSGRVWLMGSRHNIVWHDCRTTLWCLGMQFAHLSTRTFLSTVTHSNCQGESKLIKLYLLFALINVSMPVGFLVELWSTKLLAIISSIHHFTFVLHIVAQLRSHQLSRKPTVL